MKSSLSRQSYSSYCLDATYTWHDPDTFGSWCDRPCSIKSPFNQREKSGDIRENRGFSACLRWAPSLSPPPFSSLSPQRPGRKNQRNRSKKSSVRAPLMEEARTPQFFKVLIGDFARRIVSSLSSSSPPLFLLCFADPSLSVFAFAGQVWAWSVKALRAPAFSGAKLGHLVPQMKLLTLLH